MEHVTLSTECKRIGINTYDVLTESNSVSLQSSLLWHSAKTASLQRFTLPVILAAVNYTPLTKADVTHTLCLFNGICCHKLKMFVLF